MKELNDIIEKVKQSEKEAEDAAFEEFCSKEVRNMLREIESAQKNLDNKVARLGKATIEELRINFNRGSLSTRETRTNLMDNFLAQRTVLI